VFELATAVRDGLTLYGESGGSEHLERMAQRARKWEREADVLVSRIRELVQQSHKPEIYLALLREQDDAADALEEGAFLMTLLPKIEPAAPLRDPILSLATMLVGDAQETVKLMEAASHVRREGAREELQDLTRLSRTSSTTCRISSSRSRTAVSRFSRRAMPNARRGPP
jgi:uncharacterized protein Yka (UPF0111/DUF47 family)